MRMSAIVSECLKGTKFVVQSPLYVVILGFSMKLNEKGETLEKWVTVHSSAVFPLSLC